MKRLIVATMMILAALTAGAKAKGDWKGKVVDELGRPIEYANVAILSKADSTVLCGTVTAEDGTFNIVTKEEDGIMMVAILGYRTLYLAPVDGAVITLHEDTSLLESAVATAVMPKTRLTGEGIATAVHGSVLENAGTANDVLSRTPGLIKGQNGLEVIGKGAPVIYINGRRLTDATELDRLQSHEIQSVEVIVNPGSQYDASVRAVVRIKTIRRQGEGFGFNVSLSDSQSLRKKDNNDPEAQLNVNYRTGGVDIFAGGFYSEYSGFQDSQLAQETLAAHKYTQNETLRYDSGWNYAGLNGGLNWQIADNHFTGFKVNWQRYNARDEHTLMEGDILLDGSLLDHLRTDSEGHNGERAPYNFGANAYYNGAVGKLGIDLNLDYFTNFDGMRSVSREQSLIQDATVTSETASDNRLYAAKLVLSYPVWKGMLQLGTEETFTRRNDNYSVQGSFIPSAQSRVREDNIAAFVNYGFVLGRIGQVSAGVRYEHVNYAYDDLMGNGSFARRYDNFFPSVSFAGVFGPVQTMLSYSARTVRPGFSMLSNAIRYNNRYTLQSGNAALQPQIIHSVSATALWKFLTFTVEYMRIDNFFTTWARPYNDEGVILLRPENLDQPGRGLAAFITATPTIGVWNLTYTVGVQQQWLKVGELDFSDQPMWIAQLNNTFSLKRGWQLELGYEYHSPGYSYVTRITNHYHSLRAAVQKTLLKDGSLVLRLEGSDLAYLGHYNVSSNLGSYRIDQLNRMDTQRIKLTVRYRFNTAPSKYKGTGAGNDTRDRMK